MDEQVYVQSIAIKMKLPDGGHTTGKFMGIALCSPEQWEQIKNSDKGLADWLVEGEDSILFQDPMSLEEAISDKENYNDIVDMVREELRNEHHEQLKENQED